MKKRIIILDDDSYKMTEILKDMKIELSDMEILEISADDLNIIKNILSKNNKEIDCITEKLYLLGFPNYKIGYRYIVDAILLWNKYKDIHVLNMSFIYKKLSIKYNKTISSVEKAIRKCIEYTFTFGNLKELNKLFETDISVHTGKINNKKFISKMAQYISD